MPGLFDNQTCQYVNLPEIEQGACKSKKMEKTVPVTYVLVDFENIQPNDVGSIKGQPFKIMLFLGPHQTRIPVTLAMSLQALGKDVEYILIETAGRNSLDFHIAYYAGFLLADDPGATLYIVSKDTGFDPLLKHLQRKGRVAGRVSSIGEINKSGVVIDVAPESEINAIVEDLVRRKNAKPRTQKTLQSTIRALFKNRLSEQQETALLAELCFRGIVKINGTKVSYSL